MAPRAPKTPGKRKQESHQSRGAPVRLRYDEDVPPGLPAAPRNVDHLISERQSPPFIATEDLIFMVLDVVEEAGGGRFRVWGVCPLGRSICLTVDNFELYFYIAAPERPVPGSFYEPGALQASTAIDWEREPGALSTLRTLLNRTAHPDCQIARIEAVHRRPIMYYRPDAPDGGTYLRVVLQRGGNAKRAGTAVQRATTAKRFVPDGFVWQDYTLYEHEVAPLQRFLTDVPASAGAWLCVPSAARGGGGGVPTPQKRAVVGPSGPQQPNGEGYSLVGPGAAVAAVDVEATAPWRSVVCLTPDATQLADQGWLPFAGTAPPSPAAEAAAAAARRGDIAPLRVMVLDVCCATRNAEERAPVPAEGDPVVAISCALLPLGSAAAPGAVEAAAGGPEEPKDDVIELLSSDEADVDVGGAEEDGGGAQVVGPSVAEVTGGPRSSQRVAAAAGAGTPRAVTFVLHTAASNGAYLRELSHNAHVVVCASEAELLLTWQAYTMRADPDVIALFQVGHTLEALSQRFTALRLGSSGGLLLSRLRGHASPPVSIKKITMYSAAWVKSQSRMSSTSNQETYRADVDGRLVVDVLRQILTSQGLGSFSMADCVASLLGQTMETLGAHRLAALAGVGALPPLGPPEQANTQQKVYKPWEEDALRVARYSLRRVAAVRDLMSRLATLPEAFEMARAVGLSVGQVMYNAQMIRTWSLLLRVARREGVIVNSREETAPLTQHTFILHPVEAGTNGIYRQPVAILDFASLYPSIYRAHNMCYSTLAAPEDVGSLSPGSLISTPTGARFVSPDVRPGILPSILAALTAARAAARSQLATTSDPATRAVLDARQRALKVTANALYGFTGAQASPLQCVPLADSCLAIGAASCRRAREVLESAAAAGELGAANRTARVIYGHTDSLFLLLPGAADVADAIALGRRAAGIVTAAFPPPMELKFERVCDPLLLLHVNRYAGRAFEKESDVAASGVLIVKGLKSMWRQAAPILRTTLHGALVRILMRDDVTGAVEFVQSEVYRLLCGKVGAHELTMTGGLWRLTGEQVASAAAVGEETGGGNGAGTSRGGKASGGKAGGGKEEEDVRGPHGALAVRLKQRDPGRAFVLGERLPYVLTAGHRLQDAAAEDPLTAARDRVGLDYALYWKNKMMKPLEEVFKPVLTPAQLQTLLHTGPHTLVRVDRGAGAGAQGPTSPTPGKGNGGSGGRQMGMTSFFKATAKCLGCRRGMSNFKGNADDAPGLCDSCAGEPGRWAEAYLGALREAEEAEARGAAAAAACRSCDSATLGQPVLCDNGECPVTYARLDAAADGATAATALRRLDIF